MKWWYLGPRNSDVCDWMEMHRTYQIINQKSKGIGNQIVIDLIRMFIKLIEFDHFD